jgi:chromatin remodeling complex protein RSC6
MCGNGSIEKVEGEEAAEKEEEEEEEEEEEQEEEEEEEEEEGEKEEHGDGDGDAAAKEEESNDETARCPLPNVEVLASLWQWDRYWWQLCTYRAALHLAVRLRMSPGEAWVPNRQWMRAARLNEVAEPSVTTNVSAC